MKKRTDSEEWAPFIEIVHRMNATYNYDVYNEYINTYPKKDQMLAALALSVAKWHPANWTWLMEDATRNGSHTCGACLYFADNCEKCPLPPCCAPNSIWSRADEMLCEWESEGYWDNENEPKPSPRQVRAALGNMFNMVAGIYAKKLKARG